MSTAYPVRGGSVGRHTRLPGPINIPPTSAVREMAPVRTPEPDPWDDTVKFQGPGGGFRLVLTEEP